MDSETRQIAKILYQKYTRGYSISKVLIKSFDKSVRAKPLGHRTKVERTYDVQKMSWTASECLIYVHFASCVQGVEKLMTTQLIHMSIYLCILPERIFEIIDKMLLGW